MRSIIRIPDSMPRSRRTDLGVTIWTLVERDTVSIPTPTDRSALRGAQSIRFGERATSARGGVIGRAWVTYHAISQDVRLVAPRSLRRTKPVAAAETTLLLGARIPPARVLVQLGIHVTT